jgi:hypothetical protein
LPAQWPNDVSVPPAPSLDWEVQSRKKTFPGKTRTKSVSREKKPGHKNHSKESGIVIGRSVSNGSISWKGADLSVHHYIGNIDLESNNDEIKSYIEEKGITVLGFEENQPKYEPKCFKSFHLTLKKSDLPNSEDPDIWPQDVVVRQFFVPRKPRESKNSNTDEISVSVGAS